MRKCAKTDHKVIVVTDNYYYSTSQLQPRFTGFFVTKNRFCACQTFLSLRLNTVEKQQNQIHEKNRSPF